MNNSILWEPSTTRQNASHALMFIRKLKSSGVLHSESFRDLYDWSIRDPLHFWSELCDFAQIRWGTRSSVILKNPDTMLGAAWFPEARLNFAENLLRRSDQTPAIIFWGESQLRREISHAELNNQVGQFQSFLKNAALSIGDRVAAYVPNLPEVVSCCLGSIAHGATWSSCSPDFGVSGVVDRFGQIEPRLLITADGYWHKGRWIDSLENAAQIRSQIPSVQQIVIIPYDGTSVRGTRPSGSVTTQEIFTSSETKPDFIQLPFNHPLYIMYSSGTTGKPKCIIHGAGGTLLEQVKEHLLHADHHAQDRVFYQTTCGWMMWNWLIAALACESTLILYDGAPFHEDGRILWRMAEAERVNSFGTNAKYLSALEKEKISPKNEFSLPTLRTVLSTGSVLLPQSFDYVYSEVGSDLCLSSISGGTDILGCFALGSPLLPVRRGELQTRSLALNVQVFNAEGHAVTGEMGELVCTAPFPSMPVGFWNDPQGEKYRAAYFSKFPEVWTHGDYIQLTAEGGLIFHGRSDAVLNPGGIRIGTAEIYREVEKIPEIVESVVVGFTSQGDEQVILCVVLTPSTTLSAQLQETIRSALRKNLSPFHSPKQIFAVTDIPRTRNGKISELAVKELLHGRTIQNQEALSNPDSTLQYLEIAQKLSGQ